MKEEVSTRRTRPKQAVCDEENVFYSGYRSTFEKQFPTDSCLERLKWILCAIICFYMCLGKSPGQTYADMKKVTNFALGFLVEVDETAST